MEGLAWPHSHVRQWVLLNAGCFSSPRCLSSRESDLGAALAGAPEERVPMAGSPEAACVWRLGWGRAGVPQFPVLPGFQAEPHAHPAPTH